ncbi:MAG: cytochrome c maturation protein CcmE [Hyphomicrobiales bacterium]|nr:cytochrome c maturation protein CcmE [Hyphomicrobiales bacterium]
MTRKGRRAALVAGMVALAGSGVGVTLYALSGSVEFFMGPSEAMARGMPVGRPMRLGGLVETGSVTHAKDGTLDFKVTDGKAAVPVSFKGIPPDLFREGQGVVVEGARGGAGTFRASIVLAKHDERYMPKDVADALKKQGRWNDGAAAPAAAIPAASPKP